MYFIPFEAGHLRTLKPQAAQRRVTPYLLDERMTLLENEYALTLTSDGQKLMCCGAVPRSQSRAEVWSILSELVTAKNFLGVHAQGKQFLSGLPFKRLEMIVDVNFDAGHRWAKCLGFEVEAPMMKAYDFDGRDSALYARVGA